MPALSREFSDFTDIRVTYILISSRFSVEFSIVVLKTKATFCPFNELRQNSFLERHADFWSHWHRTWHKTRTISMQPRNLSCDITRCWWNLDIFHVLSVRPEYPNGYTGLVPPSILVSMKFINALRIMILLLLCSVWLFPVCFSGDIRVWSVWCRDRENYDKTINTGCIISSSTAIILFIQDKNLKKHMRHHHGLLCYLH